MRPAVRGCRREVLVLRETGEQFGDLAEAGTPVAVDSPQVRVRLKDVLYGACGIALVQQHGSLAQRPQSSTHSESTGNESSPASISLRRCRRPRSGSSDSANSSANVQSNQGEISAECDHCASCPASSSITRVSRRKRAILQRSDQAIISAFGLWAFPARVATSSAYRLPAARSPSSTARIPRHIGTSQL